MKLLPYLLLIALTLSGFQTEKSLKIARLKYRGGGDWYANPSSLPNLITFCNQQLRCAMATDEEVVAVGSPELFNYAFIHMTGHGNVILSSEESENLRLYLESGGFLHIDDNYGMDPFIRLELKRVFPDKELVEVPFDHPIYHQKFNFDKGLPKIHEHDGKAPKGYAIMDKGRILVFYTYECDLGDGWEDPSVHKDPEEVRMQALKMGANILSYAFMNN